jgi:4-hydroxy-tetrahydrodipicolinate reductase
MKKSPIKIGVLGGNGRMGKALVQTITASADAVVAGVTVRSTSEALGMDIGLISGLEPLGIMATDDIEAVLNQSDVVIDFTLPEATIAVLGFAIAAHTPLVIGTTGFSEAHMQQLVKASQSVPILWSANMSVGVNILAMLTEKVAHLLDDSVDIEIVEMHHKHKVDAPSGTALLLGEAAAKGRQVALEDVACKSRDGLIGARPQGEIGFATLRGGDVVGEHHVIFAGDSERIELSHKASSRQLFSKGALRCALWLEGKESGMFSMQDVLEF